MKLIKLLIGFRRYKYDREYFSDGFSKKNPIYLKKVDWKTILLLGSRKG